MEANMGATNNYPILCGGTFFTLVLEACKPVLSQDEKLSGLRDELAQSNVLVGLVKIMYPEFQISEKSEKSIKTHTNNYKSCKNNGDFYRFFDEEIDSFDDRVTSDYPATLAMMLDFVNCFIEIGSIKKEEKLVKRLLDLVNQDESTRGTEFYICESGKPVKRTDLLKINEVYLPSFLLGVWHFAVVNRRNNTIGAKTYEAWCPQDDSRRRPYKGKMGETWSDVKVTMQSSFTQHEDNGTDELQIVDTLQHVKSDKESFAASDSQTLIDIFHDVIDEYGVAEFVDDDYTATPLFWSVIQAMEQFVLNMREQLRKFRRNQDETYKNIMDFINLLGDYIRLYTSNTFTGEQEGRMYWSGIYYDWDQIHKAVAYYREQLDKLYGNITDGGTLSVHGLHPNRSKVENETSNNQTTQFQLGNNNLQIGKVETLTINN